MEKQMNQQMNQQTFMGRYLPRVMLSAVVAVWIAGCGGSNTSPTDALNGDSSGSIVTPGPVQDSPGSLPFYGTLTLNDYDWFLGPVFLGVTEVSINPLVKKRVFSGNYPRRHASGRTVFRQGCGSGVSRIVAAEAGSLPVALTPCSSEIENPGYTATDFEFSALSPDGSKIAVEAQFRANSTDNYWTIIFDTQSHLELARFGKVEPMWFDDGRLLTVSPYGGFYVTDADLTSIAPFASESITGKVRNPALSPDGSRIAFELDQQIWVMNADGSEPQVVATDSRTLRFPAWSPDGSVIAYLATPRLDRYVKAIFFIDLTSNTRFILETQRVQDGNTNTFMGPITWW